MRRVHSERNGEPYEEIADDDHDARARRITAYLNLIHLLVKRQTDTMKALPFEPANDLTRYFELLPEGELKASYRAMLSAVDEDRSTGLQSALIDQVVPGAIDVNIMTKLDRDTYLGKEKRSPEFSDALSGLRGFANSDLDAAVVFSAGLNPRLFGYLAEFDDFFPDEAGHRRQRVILKVSDYRSAFVQGKYLAKRGIWVSEYRIESGLNCGGHTFPTTGQLMGPILEEFRIKRAELIETLHTITNDALVAAGRRSLDHPLPLRITAQGGIGTFDEHNLLLTHYELDSTGWGTPFLLVPEVTNVDDAHRAKLVEASDDDVELSDAIPLRYPVLESPQLRQRSPPQNPHRDRQARQRLSEGLPGTAQHRILRTTHLHGLSEIRRPKTRSSRPGGLHPRAASHGRRGRPRQNLPVPRPCRRGGAQLRDQ